MERELTVEIADYQASQGSIRRVFWRGPGWPMAELPRRKSELGREPCRDVRARRREYVQHFYVDIS